MSDSMHPLDESLNKACREISGVNRALDEMMVAVDHTLSDLSYAHAREDDNRQRAERAEAERDALAAWVARWIEWFSGDPDDDTGEWIDEGWSIAKDAPKTSLAALKAQWQAEAIARVICDLEAEFDPCHPIIERVEHIESEYLRQAGGDV